jgi:hypothetical protein
VADPVAGESCGDCPAEIRQEDLSLPSITHNAKLLIFFVAGKNNCIGMVWKPLKMIIFEVGNNNGGNLPKKRIYE